MSPFCKGVAVFLLIIAFWGVFIPAPVRAGGVVESVIGVVVLVVWIVDEVVDYGRDQGWWGADLTPERKGGGPTPTEREVNPNNLRVELQTLDWNEEIDKPVSINITIKDQASGSIIRDLPAEIGLYVVHSSSAIQLVEGYSSPNAASAYSTDNYVAINDYPQVTVAGVPAEIKYSIKSQCQSVRMDVMDSSANVVYSLSESSPNPAKPLPFVWKGVNSAGSKAPAGTYSLRLKARKNDGSAEYSSIQVMSVGDSIQAGAEHQLTSFSGGVATVRAWPPVDGSPATDTVTIKLKYMEEIISTASQTVNFAGGDAPKIIGEEYSIPDITKFDQTIDSLPLRLEMFGPNNARFGKVNLIFYPMDSSRKYTYTYNSLNGEMLIVGPSGSSTNYSENVNGNEYAIALSIFNYYAKKMFEKAGYYIDVKAGKISVDGAIRRNTVGIQINGEKTTVNINGMDYQYNSSTGKVLTADVVNWGNELVADLGGGDVQAASVRAAANNTGPTIANLVFLEVICLRQYEFKAAIKVHNYMKKVASGEQFKPLEKPVLPEITDAIPSADYSRVTLYGRGKSGADMKIVVNNNDKKAVQWPSSSDYWEAKDVPLDYGLNKIYVRADSDYERFKLKSKTISAIRKGGGSGYDVSLVMVAPPENYVIGCDFSLDSRFGFMPDSYYIEAKTKVKIRVEPDANLYIGNKNIALNGNGDADSSIYLNLHEGENTLSVRSTRNRDRTEFTQKVIGALRFTQYNKNLGKNEAYIIQPGDFLFNEDDSLRGEFIIPLFPDHAGIYIGGGFIVEAIQPKVVCWALYDDPNRGKDANKNSFYGTGKNFYGVTRVPYFDEDVDNVNRLVAIREAAALKAKKQAEEEKSYDIPIRFDLLPRIYGKYDKERNGFYCSELAYWSWEQIIGSKINKYIPLQAVLFPMDDENKASLLPALLFLNTWGNNIE